MNRSLYCREDFAVPKTRNTNKEVVTPGMKRIISVMHPEMEKSGEDDLASL